MGSLRSERQHFYGLWTANRLKQERTLAGVNHELATLGLRSYRLARRVIWSKVHSDSHHFGTSGMESSRQAHHADFRGRQKERLTKYTN